MTAPGHAFGLDLLRASAVASVLAAHGSLFFVDAVPAARWALVVLGVGGVEIFFALSGFLVGRQLLRVASGEASAWRFVQRRWWRTLPNYYLFLAINAALVAWVIDRQAPDGRFLVFAQALAWPATSAFFPESWSLAVEEWFYGLGAIAFAAAARARRPLAAVAAGLLAVLVLLPLARWLAQAAPIAMDAGVRKISLLRLDALAFGLGMAWLEREAPQRFARLASRASMAVAAAVAIVCVAALASWARDLAFFAPARSGAERLTVALVFSALPAAAALTLPCMAQWMEARGALATGVRRVSAWSYALYLTHFPLLLVMLPWTRTASLATLAMVAVAWLVLATALAAGVYRWYERPLLLRRPPLELRGATPARG